MVSKNLLIEPYQLWTVSKVKGNDVWINLVLFSFSLSVDTQMKYVFKLQKKDLFHGNARWYHS